MAAMTGENLLNSIIESTGVEISTLIFNTLSAKLQQMIDNGTYSNLAASIAMSSFSTGINGATEIGDLSDTVETNAGLIEAAADQAAVDEIDFPPIGGGDTTPPTLDSFTPADDATEVPVDADLVFTFSESVQAGTGTIAVFDADGLVEAVSVENAIFDGNTVTVDLLTDLDPGTEYFVRVQPTAIEDEAGNAFAGIAAPTDFNFTTAGAGGGLTEVDITNGSNEDAAGDDFQYNAPLADTDIFSAKIANFSDGDVINIDDEFLGAANLLFDTSGADEINFAFGDMGDFKPSFTLNLTGVDAALVTAVEGAADSVAVLGVLGAAWGADWLI